MSDTFDGANLQKNIDYTTAADLELAAKHQGSVILVTDDADITFGAGAFVPGFTCTIVNGGDYAKSVKITIDPGAGKKLYAIGVNSAAAKKLVNESAGEGIARITVLDANEAGACTSGTWTQP